MFISTVFSLPSASLSLSLLCSGPNSEADLVHLFTSQRGLSHLPVGENEALGTRAMGSMRGMGSLGWDKEFEGAVCNYNLIQFDWLSSSNIKNILPESWTTPLNHLSL